MIRSIVEAGDVQGKYVLVRSSCNVPLDENGKVSNLYRLKQALPTLQYLKDAGARTIILGHIGRDEQDSLYPVYEALNSLTPVGWGGVVGSSELKQAREQMKDGDIILIENLRRDERETTLNPQFGAELAALGDIYVNDAFDNVHRDHTSMMIPPMMLPHFGGVTLCAELKHLAAVTKPERPALFILGGAKFETKLPLIEKYINAYDVVFIGGALANDILVADGHIVGTSLVSDMKLNGQNFLSSPKLIRPIDLVVEGPRGIRTCLVNEVLADEKIIDMGPATVAALAPHIAAAKTILWNGPLGLYENGVPGSTQEVAKLIAQSEALSVLGGGDTVAAVEDLGLNDQFGFVSTGGGAMLTLLEAGNTNALKVLGYEGN